MLSPRKSHEHPEPERPAPSAVNPTPPEAAPVMAACEDFKCVVIHLIEDEPVLREYGRHLFESVGWDVRTYESAESFLAIPRPSGDDCLVVDVMLPGMNGVELLMKLRKEGSTVPAIMLTGRDDAATAVSALRAGAVDYIEKPAERELLLASVASAITCARDVRVRENVQAQAVARFDSLSRRETDVLMMVLGGIPNKNIAAELGISQRTVETHRARVMAKAGAASLPDLVRLFITAEGTS